MCVCGGLCVSVCVSVGVCVCVFRERERERERDFCILVSCILLGGGMGRDVFLVSF